MASSGFRGAGVHYALANSEFRVRGHLRRIPMTTHADSCKPKGYRTATQQASDTMSTLANAPQPLPLIHSMTLGRIAQIAGTTTNRLM